MYNKYSLETFTCPPHTKTEERPFVCCCRFFFVPFFFRIKINDALWLHHALYNSLHHNLIMMLGICFSFSFHFCLQAFFSANAAAQASRRSSPRVTNEAVQKAVSRRWRLKTCFLFYFYSWCLKWHALINFLLPGTIILVRVGCWFEGLWPPPSHECECQVGCPAEEVEPSCSSDHHNRILPSDHWS